MAGRLAWDEVCKAQELTHKQRKKLHREIEVYYGGDCIREDGYNTFIMNI